MWNKAELGLYLDSAIYFVALGKIVEISDLQCPCGGNWIESHFLSKVVLKTKFVWPWMM